MLINVFARLRGLSRWLLRLMLLVAACGCSSTKEWPVYRLYEGNMRPLSEVAVILADYGVRIEEIDGSFLIKDLPESYEETIEYHIPLGRHDITASYKRTGFERIESGDPITITRDFNAGTVYGLWAKTPTRYVYGGSRDYGVWSLDLFTKGPIDKAACSTTFDPPKPTGDLIADLEPLRTIYVPPAHWVELRKLHCPEKVVGQEQ